MIWDGTSEDIAEWFDKVFKRKEKQQLDFEISESDIG